MSNSRAPAVHIRREYEPPPALSHAIRRYMALVAMPSNHGVDPMRENFRRQLLARGPVAVSPIASVDGALQFGHVAVDSRRRMWRFRAVDPATGRCVHQHYLEAETLEEARAKGASEMTGRYWQDVLRNTDGKVPAALVGSALAI